MFTKIAITLILMLPLAAPKIQLEYPSGYWRLDRCTKMSIRKQIRLDRKAERINKRDEKLLQ